MARKKIKGICQKRCEINGLWYKNKIEQKPPKTLKHIIMHCNHTFFKFAIHNLQPHSCSFKYLLSHTRNYILTYH